VEHNSYNGAELLDFVRRRMSLSSYYQPLVIQALILAPGQRVPAEDLARTLLLQDRFAVGKALKTLKRWPKITLGRHGIAYYDRERREFIWRSARRPSVPGSRRRRRRLPRSFTG